MSPSISIAIVVAYVLVMLWVGWLSMRKTRDVKDFFIGGRSLGPWMSAFAFGTTYFSAVLFIGYAGKLGWQFGIYTMWIVLGNTVVGTILSWKVLAGRTRDMTARLSAITMPEFLKVRFQSPGLQVFAAAVMFVFLVPYSASVLMGLSFLFEMTLHIPYTAALYLLTGLTAVYLVMGGYFAVAISDFIRGIVEFAGVMIMVWLLVHLPGIGGFGGATAQLLGDPAVAAPALLQVSTIGAGPLAMQVPGWATLAALVLITSLGPWALPQMVQKFYSIRSRADVTRAMTIAGVFALFMAFGAYYSGALTHLFYGAQLPAELINAKGAPIYDKIMPHFITTSGLPAALVLVIVLMVFSASMSSLSSLVLVSSSAVAIDIYGAFVDHQQHPKRTMTLLRVLCAVFVGLSLLIALTQWDAIVNLMVMSWGTLSGVFLAPYLYGLFWRRTTRAGVWAGMASGLATAVGLFLAWGKAGVPLAGAAAMLLPLAVVPAVSLLTRAPEEKVLAAAFGAAKEEPASPGLAPGV